MPSVGIIGSGMAGLACARHLADAGWSPVVFDKGRGVGGRVATRRLDGDVQFDHGAQYVTARDQGFRSVIANMSKSGAAIRWNVGSGDPRFVGTPGMANLAKYLAKGLDVRQGMTATAVRRSDGRSEIVVDGEVSHYFDRVVVTAPAPQALALLETQETFLSDFADVKYEPCLTLMANLNTEVSEGFSCRSDSDAELAWIANDSSKPGRTGKGCWVAQANAGWSAVNLELDLNSIKTKMLPLLIRELGIAADAVVHSAAHRWRFAKVVQPLGRRFVRNADATIYAGGDWCLGARVEAAWMSGDAIARDILEAP
ncbi:MAG: NAD(P)-binding protein [Anderseniella sp.]|nr:NAD(P)-binding protein [Anderseniella sp.]